MIRQADIENVLRNGDEESRHTALESLKKHRSGDFFQLLMLAMGDSSWRVRKEAVEMFLAARPSDAHISQLAEKLRDEANAGLRNSAAEALIRLGRRSVDPLLALAGDSDVDVRKFAIDVMGGIGSRIFVPELVRLLDDDDENVAAAAAEQLGNIGDNSCVDALLVAVVSRKAPLFRFCALTALGRLNARRRISDEVLAIADDEILRKPLYECLGSISDEFAAALLQEGFQARQPKTRVAALKAWYRIYRGCGTAAKLSMEAALKGWHDTDRLDQILNSYDPDDADCAEAVSALLGIIGDLRGLRILLRAYQDERVSAAAVAALKRIGNEALLKLPELYECDDDAIRAAVCGLVAEFGYADGTALICRGLKDNCPDVRKAAVNAVGLLGLSGCINDLTRIMNEDGPDLQAAVVSCLKALAKVSPGVVCQAVAALAVSDRPEIRRDAAMLLEVVDCGKTLTGLVKDEDSSVRMAAVVSIGRQRDPSSCGLLKNALLDEHPDVRIAAADALVSCNCSDLSALLLHALKDDDVWVQCAVLKCIARVDGSILTDAVRAVIGSSDTFLLVTCLELLEGIGTDEALDMVASLADSGNRDVAELACSILDRFSSENP